MVRQVRSLNELQSQLRAAGSKLVVVDFTASWCGPSRRIQPKFEGWSQRYRDVVFLKVDVDEAKDAARHYDIEAYPTFIFFKQNRQVKKIIGADEDGIQNGIATYRHDDTQETDSQALVQQVHSLVQLQSKLRAAGSKIVVVDFTASWCPPSRAIQPKLMIMAMEYTNVTFLKVDIDDASDAADHYDIEAYPTFLFFKQSRQVGKIVGADESGIRNTLNRLIPTPFFYVEYS